MSALVATGLAASNGEARRAIKGGGVRVNDKPVNDERMMLASADMADGAVKLSLGRKRHALVKQV